MRGKSSDGLSTKNHLSSAHTHTGLHKLANINCKHSTNVYLSNVFTNHQVGR